MTTGWIVVGVVAFWVLVAVMIGVWIGLALRTADIEDEARRVRRDECDVVEKEPHHDPESAV
ncbi:hypothetical protein ASG56_07175 [Rhodococcus sp. Leaf7]|uniref:hypothetical protein n=1 Tax=unclassified Rhodococcus (in: high G+C Gram-positive bacteria) TaxID=192944 RepID=UPI0006FB0B32|nr:MULTISPECIES: hypothetical protein [unclassified Rhodococcus (in: high G+C Gram-positive bacteria)]KQU07301.1 hypothetical protein ASG56_07175 [Rhodococcus sp. Leaf7]KQU42819.1 hypothetical protein ASG64_07175 [Rhodococcus sp. Leaf247]